LSSLAIAASSTRSRRAIWSFCTRSVVLVNNTRQPFSIRAMPSAAARCDLPPPGGPKHKRLAPFSSQASLAASACTCAFETIGTASKSNASLKEFLETGKRRLAGARSDVWRGEGSSSRGHRRPQGARDWPWRTGCLNMHEQGWGERGNAGKSLSATSPSLWSRPARTRGSSIPFFIARAREGTLIEIYIDARCFRKLK
jgi:hypothetical protein